MRKISIVASLVLLMLMAIEANAQKKRHKKVKTGDNKETGPPPWASAHEYRAKPKYVYFTEHNFYYDHKKGVYIYLSEKKWEVFAELPDLFKNLNLAVEVNVDFDFS